ncbi:hypothetical protein HZA96_04475 [Candidatus Woesearchaeota archaeon]|nr:hypothetical protein [Candidatus Woesearchaeota archaeon]
MEKSNGKYFLVIVAIVAVVAIVSLFMVGGNKVVKVSDSSAAEPEATSDLAGQAISGAKMADLQFDTSGNAAIIKIITIDNKQLKLDLKTSAPNYTYYIWGDALEGVDTKMYLQGDICDGEMLTDCKGATFLVSAGQKKAAHLIKISKIDATDKKISFDDLTYGCATNDKSFKLGYADYYALSCGAGTIYLGFTDDGNLQFKQLGEGYSKDSSYVEIQTRSKLFVRFENTKQGEVQPYWAGNSLFEGVTFHK